MNMMRQALAGPPDQVCIRDFTADPWDVTYRDLAHMTGRLARGLLRHVAPGDRVGVLFSQDPWCAASHLAIWKIGAISVPLFTLFKRDALQSRVRDAGITYVLTDRSGADLLGDLAVPLLADEIGEDGPGIKTVEAPEHATLIYTSGTTGAPKGALHGHEVLNGHLPGVKVSHNHLGQPGDCLWTPADWAWIGGLFDVLMPGLALGVPVVAHRAPKFDPAGAADLIARAGVRNVFFPPTALRLMKAADVQIPGLRSVASGGEPLGAEMLAWGRDAFGLVINEFYGQTECNMVVSACAADFETPAGCMGKPVPGFDVDVIDDRGMRTANEGDIAVRRPAPSMMQGYWQNSEATAQKFRGDWLITGDRGVRQGAFVRFVGRDDDVITSSGYRIGPSEIEDCLLHHPDVATCAVVGKPDALRTEIVKAFVVPKDGASPAIDALQAWVKERLATYSYPREIELVDALPMTVTGKVMRKVLKARAARETEETGSP
ncbi:MAG: AMP-binding protein [Pseudomonadota bacterium]